MTDLPSSGEPELGARLDRMARDLADLAARPPAPSLPAELPGQLDALGSAMTEVRLHLASLASVDDRLDRLEELVTAMARQLTRDAEAQRTREDAATAAPSALASIESTLDRVHEGMEPLRESTTVTQDRVAVIASSTEALARALDAVATRTERRVQEAATAMTDALRPIADSIAALGTGTTEPAAELTAGIAEAAAAAKAAQGAVSALGEGIVTNQSRSLDNLSAQLRAQLDRVSSENARSMESLASELRHELAKAGGDTVDARISGIAAEVRQAATDAATNAGLAAAEASIAAAEAAGEAILTDQDTRFNALRDALEDLRARLANLDEGLGAEIATDIADASRQAVADAGQGIVSTAVSTLERAGMSAQADMQRATDAALDALLAAVDARLATAAVAAGPPLTLDAMTDLLEQMANSIADTAAQSAAEEFRTTSLHAVADAARAASHAAANAAASSAAEASEILAETTTATIHEAVESIEETVKQALSIRGVHRPPEGHELTAAMMSAVAASLDEFALRVESDLDHMGSRLAALAEVLEQLVEETASRRRGGGLATLELLRQVASDGPEPPPRPRKRSNRTAS